MQLNIDNDREYIQWWIEDEEAWLDEQSWYRENVPGYRPYEGPRGVVELDLGREVGQVFSGRGRGLTPGVPKILASTRIHNF